MRSHRSVSTSGLQQHARHPLRPARRRCTYVSAIADNGPSTSEPARPPPHYAIRRASARDAKAVALICAEAFGRGNFPGVESEALDRLETRYFNVIEEGMQEKLLEALEVKDQAQREHREFRLRQYMQRLRAQLAALRGEPARFPSQLSPKDERAVQRWRRSRQFAVLLAEERAPGATGSRERYQQQAQEVQEASSSTSSSSSSSNSTGDSHLSQPGAQEQRQQQQSSSSASTSQAGPGPSSTAAAAAAAGPAAAPATAAATATAPSAAAALSTAASAAAGLGVACASLSLMQPEALLPPPFPSNKPFRLYVSNMSVVPSHRRRGLAKKLLLECERVARLWGYSSLWLHVKRSNAGAASLYLSMGYRQVDEGVLRLLPGPLKQVLMTKDLPPLKSGCPMLLGQAARSGAGTGVASESGLAAADGGSGGSNGGGGRDGDGGDGGGDVVRGVSGESRSGVFVWNAVVSSADGKQTGTQAGGEDSG